MDYPNFYSILPASVRYDNSLNDSEKIFFSEITALSNKYGYCNASNSYFSKLYNVHKTTVSSRINKLKKTGHIQIELIYDGKQIKERRIYPITNINSIPKHNKVNPISQNANTPISQNANTPISQNANTPISQNAKDNNTSINITRINRERAEGDCIQKYQNEIGILNPNQIQQLIDWVEDFNKNNEGEAIISEAINQSVKEKAKSFAYLNNKLKRYADAKVETVEQAKQQSKDNKTPYKKKDVDVSSILEDM